MPHNEDRHVQPLPTAPPPDDEEEREDFFVPMPFIETLPTAIPWEDEIDSWPTVIPWEDELIEVICYRVLQIMLIHREKDLFCLRY